MIRLPQKNHSLVPVRWNQLIIEGLYFTREKSSTEEGWKWFYRALCLYSVTLYTMRKYLILGNEHSVLKFVLIEYGQILLSVNFYAYFFNVFQTKKILSKKFKKCKQRTHSVNGWCVFVAIHLNNSYITLKIVIYSKNYSCVKKPKFFWTFLPCKIHQCL